MMTMRLGLSVLAVVAACDAAPEAAHTSALTGDTHYEIRVAEPTIGANGHTKHEVLAFGIRADGSVADDPIVIGNSRLGSGELTQTALTLGPLGATTYFTPCDSTVGGCLGPLQLTLALASDPTTVLATRDIELVAPTHPSTVAPCLGHGTTLYLDTPFTSNGRGQLRITDIGGTPYTQVDPASPPDYVKLMLGSAHVTEGGWSMDFDAFQLPGTLGVGLFADAQQTSTTQAGHPAMNIHAEIPCSSISGSFEIYELSVSSQLEAFTVSFEQFCGGAALLEGCLHYEK